MPDQEKWDRPQPVDDLTLAFPAHVVGVLMPDMEEIPEEFRRDTGEAIVWVKLQRDWFFSGLKDPRFHCKEGVDGETAFRHLSAIQGSFEPKHEHKQAAVAYLASRWFHKVEYDATTPPPEEDRDD